MDDRPTIAFHIGFHKTATTLVQSLYKRLGRTTSAAHVAPSHEAYLPLRRLLLRHRNTGRRAPQLNAAVATFLGAMGDAPVVRVSDENIIGATPFAHPSHASGRLYERLEEQAALLERLFSERALTFLVTTRPAADTIHALYADGLRYGRYRMTFAQYLSRLDVPSFDHTVVAARLRQATDRPVKEVPFTLLSTDPPAFLRAILSEPDAAALPADAVRRVNRRLPPARLSLLRQMAPFPVKHAAAVRAWLETCPVPLGPADADYPDVAMTEAERAAIEAAVSPAARAAP